VPTVLKSGGLTFMEPSGSVQGCNGIALPLPLHWRLGLLGYDMQYIFFPLRAFFPPEMKGDEIRMTSLRTTFGETARQSADYPEHRQVRNYVMRHPSQKRRA
jgi:hypothetical protein